MGEATRRFFEAVDRRGHDPRLSGAVGTVRFDLTEGDEVDHWFISIDDGNLSVSREAPRDADAVLSADAGLFERAVRGEANVVTAMLRGAVVITGDLRLLIQLERLLPGPPNARGPRCLRPGGREKEPA